MLMIMLQCAIRSKFLVIRLSLQVSYPAGTFSVWRGSRQHRNYGMDSRGCNSWLYLTPLRERPFATETLRHRSIRSITNLAIHHAISLRQVYFLFPLQMSLFCNKCGYGHISWDLGVYIAHSNLINNKKAWGWLPFGLRKTIGRKTILETAISQAWWGLGGYASEVVWLYKRFFSSQLETNWYLFDDSDHIWFDYVHIWFII